jgi:hypothetical protein
MAVAILGALGPAVAQAGPISWADWTISNLSTTNGTVGGVGATFLGQLQFAQLGSGNQIGSGGIATEDYWIERPGPAPYTGNAVVDNRPPGYELLAFAQPSTNSLIFDSPILNPVMAIVSMGQFGGSVTYDFDRPFTVLSEGFGYWGDGFFSLGGGDVLVGTELHAVIQFHGSVSQINWTSTNEFWHGFTVGAPVPEPGTMGLIATGLLGIGARLRRRKA